MKVIGDKADVGVVVPASCGGCCSTVHGVVQEPTEQEAVVSVSSKADIN